MADATTRTAKRSAKRPTKKSANGRTPRRAPAKRTTAKRTTAKRTGAKRVGAKRTTAKRQQAKAAATGRTVKSTAKKGSGGRGAAKQAQRVTRKASGRRPSTTVGVPVPHPTMPHLDFWHLPLPRSLAVSLARLPRPSMPQMPRMQLPRMPDGKPDGRAGQVLWYGGLAAVAALGVVEWPVAAVVAAGSYVVDRRMKSARRTTPPDARAGRRKETRTRTRPTTGRPRRPR